MMIRAQEMARYVEDGVLDAGLTGRDWIEESEARGPRRRRLDLRQAELRKSALGAGRARGVELSERPRSRGQDHRHRAGGHDRNAIWRSNGVKAKVEFSWGATEVKPPVLADAIVEVTETGSSLRANKLRIIDTVLESNTQLIANRRLPGKTREAPQARRHPHAAGGRHQRAGQGRHDAQRSQGECLPAVLAVLPALKRPTISHLSDEDWLAVNTILDETTVRDIIPRLKQAGGEGIVEYPLNKIVM